MLYAIIILLVALYVIGILVFTALGNIRKTLDNIYNNDKGIFNNNLKQTLILIKIAEKEGFDVLKIFDDHKEQEIQMRRDIRDEIEQYFQ